MLTETNAIVTFSSSFVLKRKHFFLFFAIYLKLTITIYEKLPKNVYIQLKIAYING